MRLALDWTPNVNHVGFFVAAAKGYYSELGLEVEILSIDDYAITPAKKIELGHAEVALCPMESVLSYKTKKLPFEFRAIASLFQDDLSAVVALKGTGIERPKDLDGKIYASYKARYEDTIVKAMVKNDGGSGEICLHYPEKLGIWNTLLSKESDATWIFMNWEGILAEAEGIELVSFKLSDFGIPYCYAPVIIASDQALSSNKVEYTNFLAASKKGFLYAAEYPEEAAKILQTHTPTDSLAFLVATIKYSAPFFGDASNWGQMDPENVQRYLDWILAQGVETTPVTVDQMVNNSLLQ